jgi:hypothetical protein
MGHLPGVTFSDFFEMAWKGRPEKLPPFVTAGDLPTAIRP